MMVLDFSGNWKDNSTLEGEIVEGICQIVFWTVALNWFHIEFEKYCEKQDWLERVAKQKGGVAEFIVASRAFPQHLVAGILALVGCIIGSGQLVRHATLAEFGYESFDIFRIWYLYLNKQLDPIEGPQTVFAWTLHHLPGILAIIPANLYFSDNIYFQKIVVTLLLPGALTVYLACLIKTYDITDLAERTKFTVAYVLNIVFWCIARFWYFVWYSYLMVYDGYHEWSIGIRIICIGYFIVLSMFNTVLTMILVPRLYAFMNSKTEKELTDNAEKLQKRTTLGMLGRSQAEGLLEILDYNNKSTPRAKITKLPFRRTITEPQFKWE